MASNTLLPVLQRRLGSDSRDETVLLHQLPVFPRISAQIWFKGTQISGLLIFSRPLTAPLTVPLTRRERSTLLTWLCECAPYDHGHYYVTRELAREVFMAAKTMTLVKFFIPWLLREFERQGSTDRGGKITCLYCVWKYLGFQKPRC